MTGTGASNPIQISFTAKKKGCLSFQVVENPRSTRLLPAGKDTKCVVAMNGKGPTASLTRDVKSIFASTMEPMKSPIAGLLSTELKSSVVMPRQPLVGFVESQ
ncbi:MAG: hypothetical protein MUO52_04035, partial [Desulfobacterales bacterium]|nr:hypothetical protein [Desulfobacterales bacterium]